MVDKESLYRRYIAHSALHQFTELMFFAFGALLLYVQSGSIIAVLLFGLAGKGTALTLRTIALPLYFWLLRRLQVAGVLILGAGMTAAAFVAIFYSGDVPHLFDQLFYGAAILNGAGNTLFINVSNAVRFEAIGASDLPGRASAGAISAGLLAGVAAAITGLALDLQGQFAVALLVGAVFSLASVVPLLGVRILKPAAVSWRECASKLSRGAALANLNPDHELKVTALPLVLASIFASLSTPIWIRAVAALGMVILSHLAGNEKDRGGGRLISMAVLVYSAVWVAYGIVTTELAFVALGILAGFSDTLITTGREARLSREVLNAEAPFAATVGVEIYRTAGLLAAFVLLAGVYTITGSVPQLLLPLAAVFVLPKGLYAVGVMDSRRSAWTHRIA